MDALLSTVDDLGPLIRSSAAAGEQQGRLVSEVVEALHDGGLFRILVPSELGGFGVSLPESVQVIERVAGFDAATAWTLAILADGPLITRNFPEHVFEEVCADPRSLCVGSMNPAPVRAEPTEDGYDFNGTATYLSGSAHATWLYTAAVVTQQGRPRFDDGQIAIRTGLFPLDRARSLDNWDVSGMRATGSSDYEFDAVEVATDWTMAPLEPAVDAIDDAFAPIPLWSRLGPGIAGVAVGTASNMLNRFLELAGHKVPVGNVIQLRDRGSAQVAVGEALGLHQAAHAVLHQTADAIWARGRARREFTPTDVARDRAGLVAAVRLAAQAVDLLHDAAGMSAVRSDEVLERCWRDVHTMTQHTILSPAKFEVVGRVLLGLDPNSPLI